MSLDIKEKYYVISFLCDHTPHPSQNLESIGIKEGGPLSMPRVVQIEPTPDENVASVGNVVGYSIGEQYVAVARAQILQIEPTLDENAAPVGNVAGSSVGEQYLAMARVGEQYVPHFGFDFFAQERCLLETTEGQDEKSVHGDDLMEE